MASVSALPSVASSLSDSDIDEAPTPVKERDHTGTRKGSRPTAVPRTVVTTGGGRAGAGAGAGTGTGSSTKAARKSRKGAKAADEEVAAGGGGDGDGDGAKPAKSKKKGRKGGACAGLDADDASCLHDLGLHTFDMGRDVAKGTMPVFVLTAARGGGLTTLIGSLLIQAQETLGVKAAVVLCDRAEETYMNNILPKALVINSSPAAVLTELIAMQRTLAAARQPLAFVMDDVLYNSKVLGSEAFIQSIKRAGQFDIMVVIGTSTPSVLPARLTSSFATHVFASQCYLAEDAKHVHKSMFGAFEDSKAFLQVLALCRQFEFLVSKVCPATSLLDITRFYVPTVYVNDARPFLPEDSPPGAPTPDGIVERVFHVEERVVGYIMGIVSRTASGK
jgi:hypothetical protein